MENGKTIKQMATEYTLMLMELDTKGIGKMIFSMDMELKHGQMVRSTRATTKMERSTEREHMLGTMDLNM